jgi:hypothetical protein
MTKHLTNGMIDDCHRGCTNSNRKYLITTSMLGWSLVLFPTLAYANCASDRPCFNESYQAGNKVIFKFNGVTGWDVYNVRYLSGGRETQVENRSGSFTINNVQPNRVFTLKVQGCHKHTFGHSDCSPWVAESVTTR